MTRRALSEQEKETALRELPGWAVQAGKLHKTSRLASFARAIGWRGSGPVWPPKMDHHPEWSNVYNRVTVDLSTHDLGNAISQLDVDLARRMEDLATGQ